jgi:DNA polymerase I-like protein with 3'-5' exonuclease and polymerase domains
MAELERQPVFAFDTETTSVDTMRAGLVGVSVSWQEGEAILHSGGAHERHAAAL